MRYPRLTRGLVTALGVLYVVDGIAETVRAVQSGDGGLWFWFGFLVGGGTLILLGEWVFRGRPWLSLGLIETGCVLGMLPTMWTLIVPLFALTVFILAASRASGEVDG